ncbi:hypothetical protein Tco_0998307 [Tanacetum coccineum]
MDGECSIVLTSRQESDSCRIASVLSKTIVGYEKDQCLWVSLWDDGWGYSVGWIVGDSLVGSKTGNGRGELREFYGSRMWNDRVNRMRVRFRGRGEGMVGVLGRDRRLESEGDIGLG